MTGRAELIELTGLVRMNWGDRVLIDFGGDKPVWLPLAHIEVEPFGEGRSSTVSMPKWLAMREGLI